MHRFPWNEGDYLRDTADLSDAEDLAYRRMLGRYYSAEAPLPLDRRECYRAARANSAPMRQAVDYVLGRYFTQGEDGWHQKRANEEIAAFRESAGLVEERRAHEAERQKRHRDRRRVMFADLRAVDIVPAWDLPMPELQRLHATHVTRDRSVTEGDQQRPSNAPVTCTATAIPVTSNHKPETKNHNPSSSADLQHPRAKRANGKTVLEKTDEVQGQNRFAPSQQELERRKAEQLAQLEAMQKHQPPPSETH